MRTYFLNLAMFLIVTILLNLALVSSSFAFRDWDWDSRKITITSPEGGEKLIGERKQKISWQTSSSIRYVKIEYSINDGEEWIELVKNMKMDAPFASHEWVVPCTPTLKAKIRVSDAYGPDYDVLIIPFSIVCESESS
ncbi:MAG: hypothetical protein GWN93_02235 [Deltaproteobacteria bacterium]|nr:hypothetical protein [Deltaproteobacteria bacterium]